MKENEEHEKKTWTIDKNVLNSFFLQSIYLHLNGWKLKLHHFFFNRSIFWFKGSLVDIGNTCGSFFFVVKRNTTMNFSQDCHPTGEDQSDLQMLYHRENGGTLGMVGTLSNQPPYTPYIVGISWVYPLFKGSLGG